MSYSRFAGIVSLAVFAACNSSPVSTEHRPLPASPRADVAPAVTFSMPDTLIANEDGVCDLLISYTSTASVPAYFQTSNVTIAPGVAYSISASYLNDQVYGAIGAGSHGGVVISDSDLSPSHATAWYSGSVYVAWTLNGTYQYQFLTFTCKRPRIGY